MTRAGDIIAVYVQPLLEPQYPRLPSKRNRHSLSFGKNLSTSSLECGEEAFMPLLDSQAPGLIIIGNLTAIIGRPLDTYVMIWYI
jgi:hypothetical protein